MKARFSNPRGFLLEILNVYLFCLFNKESTVLHVVRNVGGSMYLSEIVHITLEYTASGVRLIICALIITRDMNHNWSHPFFLYIFINKNQIGREPLYVSFHVDHWSERGIFFSINGFYKSAS